MFNKSLPWATIGVWVLTIIFAVVGGAVVIWGDKGALSFEAYMKIMGAFVVAHGILGIGRGLNSGLTNHALLNAPLSADPLLSGHPGAEDGGDGGDRPAALEARQGHV